MKISFNHIPDLDKKDEPHMFFCFTWNKLHICPISLWTLTYHSGYLNSPNKQVFRLCLTAPYVILNNLPVPPSLLPIHFLTVILRRKGQANQTWTSLKDLGQNQRNPWFSLVSCLSDNITHSSILLTIPVAFISQFLHFAFILLLLMVYCTCSICKMGEFILRKFFNLFF